MNDTLNQIAFGLTTGTRRERGRPDPQHVGDARQRWSDPQRRTAGASSLVETAAAS